MIFVNVLQCMFKIMYINVYWDRRGHNRMLVGFTTTYQSVPINNKVESSNSLTEKCTWYNIMWSSL